MVLWRDVLRDWENGIVFQYPPHLKKFQWNTSVLKNDGNSKYEHSFKYDPLLPDKQNKAPYKEYFENPPNKYVAIFPNLSNNTILVVPIPRKGKNYATLIDFIDNAPLIQQKELWKYVAKVAKNIMKTDGRAYISVHGRGVAYTHVRISHTPIHYFDNKLL